MSTTSSEAQSDSILNGIGLPRDRAAQERHPAHSIPQGTVVVSADNHWSVTGDIFYERMPAALRDRAPRLWTDDAGVHHWHLDGKSMLPNTVIKNLSSFEAVPGCVEIAPRLADLDKEGIEKEIVFGNAINAFFSFADLEVREWVFRIYNQYLAEVATEAPDRFFGVGFVNYWDMSRAEESIGQLKDLGLKTFNLPQVPKGANGALLNYALPEMDPLWAAIEDAGLPVCFHVGEFFQDGPGGVGTSAMVNFGPFRRNLGELIFGGIFDRHPNLKVVFAEADLNWVPGALQTAEMTYDCYVGLLQPELEHRPTYYWRRNCYATFQYDPIGMAMLDRIGVDRVMWASDYPHPESTFGVGWSAIDAVTSDVSEDDARRILGSTALEVFGL
jgi:predicted TIM-barrel fold metal-dependent hydrolase